MTGQGKKKVKGTWDAKTVRALRQHLGVTQQQMADSLGTRQQTISEWEKGLYQPRGTSRTLLTIIAERAAFPYWTGQQEPSSPGGEDAPNTDRVKAVGSPEGDTPLG